LRINLTGCPNNCAHAWIADIGLRGRRLRDDATGASVEGFTVFVGGSLAGAGRIAAPLFDIGLAESAPAIRNLLNAYLAHRTGKAESFADFVTRVTRVTPEGLKELGKG
jgi:sulfite reductase beta subunit-like hemoprotein